MPDTPEISASASDQLRGLFDRLWSAVRAADVPPGVAAMALAACSGAIVAATAATDRDKAEDDAVQSLRMTAALTAGGGHA